MDVVAFVNLNLVGIVIKMTPYHIRNALIEENIVQKLQHLIIAIKNLFAWIAFNLLAAKL